MRVAPAPILALAAGVVLATACHRHETIDGTEVRTHRLTGAQEMRGPDGWEPYRTPTPAPTATPTPPPPVVIEVPKSELSGVTCFGRIGAVGDFSGTVRNGSRYTLTAIEVFINSTDMDTGRKFVSRKYRTELEDGRTLPPEEQAYFRFPTGKNVPYESNHEEVCLVVGAIGRPPE